VCLKKPFTADLPRRGNRPGGHAAKKCNELAPRHSKGIGNARFARADIRSAPIHYVSEADIQPPLRRKLSKK